MEARTDKRESNATHSSEDKVGNAFGFHANIILIPVSVKVAGRGAEWRGEQGGTEREVVNRATRRRSTVAFKPDGDGDRSGTKGQAKGGGTGAGQGNGDRGTGVARVEPKRVIRETLFSL